MNVKQGVSLFVVVVSFCCWWGCFNRTFCCIFEDVIQGSL